MQPCYLQVPQVGREHAEDSLSFSEGSLVLLEKESADKYVPPDVDAETISD